MRCELMQRALSMGWVRQAAYDASRSRFTAIPSSLPGTRTAPIDLRSGCRRRSARPFWASLVVALAERGFCAIGRGDWPAVQRFVEEAHAAVQQFGLGEYTASALSFVLAARAALRAAKSSGHETTSLGRRGFGRDSPTRVPSTIQPERCSSSPAPIVALEDTAGAREVVRQARDIWRSDPIWAASQGDRRARVEARHDAHRKRGPVVAHHCRTSARTLMPTHLTYPQIGARLYLSRNTVKSQAISIYQKLGVSSRDEAIEQMHEIGLLER